MQICKEELCTGCGACASVCAFGAIKLVLNKSFERVAQIDKNLCRNCKKCFNVCPVIKDAKYCLPTACYAGYSKDSEERTTSASGGIAASLTNSFITSGGIVYGTAYENGKFLITRADNKAKAKLFKGSKYVKSDSEEGIKNAIIDLKQGKKVLFFGTPCQVAGLKNASKDNQNLYLVDLICHGTPSQEYLEDHVREQTKKGFADIENISFRDKDGWRLKVYTNGKVVYNKSHQEDVYFKSFLNGETYRQNCYACLFAKEKRVSDVTIGDFWGLGRKKPFDESTEKVSVILVNTEKGQKLLEEYGTNIKLIAREVKEAIEGNDQLRAPTKISKNAQIFKQEIKIKPFSKAIKLTSTYKACKKLQRRNKLIRLAKKILKKI